MFFICLILITLLSIVPVFDIKLTRLIGNIDQTKRFSYIVYRYGGIFNALLNIYILYEYGFNRVYFARFLMEVLLNQLILKRHVKRKRPRYEIYLDKPYTPVYRLKLDFNNVNNNDTESFFSGHVTTVFCTCFMFGYYNYYFGFYLYSLFYV